MATKKTDKVEALPQNTAVIQRAENGDYVVRIGANPDGSLSKNSEKNGKSNPSYAGTTGWGFKSVIVDPNSPMPIPCTLRLQLTRD